MDYIKSLEADLEKGYSKSDLERLIGLPKNNLSGILKGDRKLSKKSQLKIDKWMASEKPDPLDLKYLKRIEDLAKGTHTDIDTLDRRTKIEFTKPMHVKAKKALDTANEPKENTMAFYLKYDCYTWAEVEEKKKLK